MTNLLLAFTVGDNFVRFLQGGALAVASHLYNKKKLESS